LTPKERSLYRNQAIAPKFRKFQNLTGGSDLAENPQPVVTETITLFVGAGGRCPVLAGVDAALTFYYLLLRSSIAMPTARTCICGMPPGKVGPEYMIADAGQGLPRLASFPFSAQIAPPAAIRGRHNEWRGFMQIPLKSQNMASCTKAW
jgi:hypothetical protein